MPFKLPANEPDFSDLETTLLNARIQIANNALYQTIRGLIDKIKQFQTVLRGKFDEAAVALKGVTDLTFLTATAEGAKLPNSRQLIAGTNITFDDSVANQRTVNGASTSTDDIDPFLLMGA